VIFSRICSRKRPIAVVLRVSGHPILDRLKIPKSKKNTKANFSRLILLENSTLAAQMECNDIVERQNLIVENCPDELDDENIANVPKICQTPSSNKVKHIGVPSPIISFLFG
jgi:hypothetical protein